MKEIIAKKEKMKYLLEVEKYKMAKKAAVCDGKKSKSKKAQAAEVELKPLIDIGGPQDENAEANQPKEIPSSDPKAKVNVHPY